MTDNKNYFEVNKKSWDARTLKHLESDFYDVPSFKAGHTSLRKIELAELPDLNGKELLHLQCHFGMDTMSFSRMGAQATGLDLSPESIKQARLLAQELGLDTQFLESNVLEMDQVLDKEFDYIFTSYGAICWLPDLEVWAEQIAKRLRRGGTFLMVEFHPALYMWEWEKNIIAYPYFNSGKPFHETVDGSYTDGTDDLKLEEYFWIHSLSQVHTALTNHGIQINKLKEYDYHPYNCFENSKKRAEQEYVYEINGQNIPAAFLMEGRV